MPAYRMRPMYVLSSSGGRLHRGLRQSYFSVSQSKHKPTKFMCKQRGALLTVLYQCLAAAGGACPITRKVLGCVWSRRFRLGVQIMHAASACQYLDHHVCICVLIDGHDIACCPQARVQGRC